MTSHDDWISHKAHGRPLVLVADDDVVTRMLMVEALKRAAFDVVVASDGQQAINVARTESFDAVVIDLLMPSTNGLQATQTLRAEPNRETLPIIMVSGTKDPRLQAQAFALGADDFITKPFAPSELVARVRGALRPRAGGADTVNMSRATQRAPWPPPSAAAIAAAFRCPWPPPAESPTEVISAPAARFERILRFVRPDLELGQSELRA